MTVAELLDFDDDDVVAAVNDLDTFPPDSRPHVRDWTSGSWVLIDTGAAETSWSRDHSHQRSDQLRLSRSSP